MGRAHVEFIQTQVVPWGKPLGEPLLRSTVQYKWLRQDPRSADTIRYTFDAPYRPALPSELSAYVAQPADTVALY